MTTFAAVVPLHTMIRDALTELRDARADGDPDHCGALPRVQDLQLAAPFGPSR